MTVLAVGSELAWAIPCASPLFKWRRRTSETLHHCGHTATHTIANANHSAGADAFADSVAPAIREAQAAGAKTLRQIAAALNGRGIGTPRGGK